MKHITLFTFSLILSLMFLSCDEDNEIEEVDFNQTISTALIVDLPDDSAGDPVTFAEVEAIDFSTVQQIQDNIDDIQNSTIDALSFEIENYTGASNIMATNASLEFNNTILQLQDIDLQQADSNNTIFPIDDPAVLTALESALQSSNTTMTVILNATLNSTPVYFEVVFYLDVTVTASGG